MIKITKEEVLKLGAISQIKIDEQEINSLASKLEAVLTYASYLKEVAAKNEPQPLPKNCNVDRKDTVITFNSELILDQAPVREENYFVVPMILKGPDNL